jgi:hypothetical protein
LERKKSANCKATPLPSNRAQGGIDPTSDDADKASEDEWHKRVTPHIVSTEEKSRS